MQVRILPPSLVVSSSQSDGKAMKAGLQLPARKDGAPKQTQDWRAAHNRVNRTLGTNHGYVR
jgi:hypothetical protein